MTAKQTTSRTGLHKVRAGDRIVAACAYDKRTFEALVVKVGRKLIHTTLHAFHKDEGGEVDGGGWSGWHPDEYEASVRRSEMLGKVRAAISWGTSASDLTESQLARILAILDEVPS